MSKKNPTREEMVHLFHCAFPGVKLEPANCEQTLYDSSSSYRCAKTFAERKDFKAWFFWATEKNKVDTLVILGHGWFAFLEIADLVHGETYYRIGSSYSLPFKKDRRPANYATARTTGVKFNEKVREEISNRTEQQKERERKFALVEVVNKNPNVKNSLSYDGENKIKATVPAGMSFENFLAEIEKIYSNKS